jgi:hypothetical protein
MPAADARRLADRIRGRIRWEWYRARRAWNDAVRVPWHDWTVTRHLLPEPGDLACGPRVAVYAIYPERGLLPSHLRALDHLAACGHAPFLVSNLPLSPAERAAVAPRVWRRLERPNFGFDIAGYRAAILLLAAELPRLERLVLINDSTWFPVGRGRHWLAVAAAMADPPPLVGCVTNNGFALAPLGTPQSWEHDPRRPGFHYCSFGLSLGPGVLRDPEFLAFWRRLRITDMRLEIIHRAEVGFSQWALARGHAHACTWDVAGLPGRLAQRDADELRALIAGLVIPEDAALRAWRARMLGPAGPGADRAGLVNVLLTAIAHTGPGFALPALMMDEDGFGMVKKAPLRREAESRAATLAALAGEPAILAEAEAIPGPALPGLRR